LPSASEKFLANLGKLVVKFEADKAHYLSKDYSEAQARIDFTTPFFKVSIPKTPFALNSTELVALTRHTGRNRTLVRSAEN
jgi:hypothetical protein